MSVVVSLKDIVEALDFSSEGRKCFFDTVSGEILLLTEEDQLALDQAEDESLPEWQREHIQNARELIASKRGIRLPDSFDIEERSIMEKFCYTVVELDLRETMLRSIHGKGAFSRFEENLDHFRLQEQWLSFRENTLEQIARDWLDVNGIAYKD